MLSSDEAEGEILTSAAANQHLGQRSIRTSDSANQHLGQRPIRTSDSGQSEPRTAAVHDANFCVACLSKHSPRTKNGSSVFSRSSTTTTSPGKSFRTENSSLGSEADGLCMMLRSFSRRNGSADTVTLFILHSVSWFWSSSPFRPRTPGARAAMRLHASPSSSSGRGSGVGPMLTLAISVALVSFSRSPPPPSPPPPFAISLASVSRTSWMREREAE
ncbi:hypothetical protein EYF80_012457 [Liparis tanakae]|uniref:Uncharacterized protein n=1 Tax=Liparis tanakae TaxID=230148 RepID=A0A4Z2IJK1_9TELE|nr:hypothetical protein EYF80_012457 [Liparis tanakae]